MLITLFYCNFASEITDMPQKSSLQLNLRQRQYLAQSQVQLARMLELNAPEMDEAVRREVEENPALEAEEETAPAQTTDDGRPFTETAEQMRKADYADPDDIPYYRLQVHNAGRDDDSVPFIPADNVRSLYDILLDQLRALPLEPDIRTATRYIIGNLDSNGYLRRTSQGIADDILFDLGADLSPRTVEKALDTVHNLEPYGIGASDLRECLLIQLRHRPGSQQRDDAIRILEEAFEAFSMKHTHRIISQLHLSEKRVEEAVAEILTLNPKPGAALGEGPGSQAAPVIPDFIVDVHDSEITISLNNRIPELRISETFRRAVKDMEKNAVRRREARRAGKLSGASEFMTTRYNDAREYIRLLKTRQTTLFSVMTAIVEAQREYFLTQDVRKLKPLGIKDIAEATGYDISMVSRATAQKFVATPWGILPLKYFFSTSVVDNGGRRKTPESEEKPEREEFTAKAVMELITRLVEEEDKKHPLSDEKLRQAVVAAGYPVARRTVAKYRENLHIPVARLRRKI